MANNKLGMLVPYCKALTTNELVGGGQLLKPDSLDSGFSGDVLAYGRTSPPEWSSDCRRISELF